MATKEKVQWRVLPETRAIIEKMANERGLLAGQVIDEMVRERQEPERMARPVSEAQAK